MLDTYIKATNRLVGWVFLSILEKIEPFIRIICFVLWIGGLVAGVVMLSRGWSEGFNAPLTPKFVKPTVGDMAAISSALFFVGLSLPLAYELLVDRMFLDYLFPLNKGEDTRTIGRKVLDWAGALLPLVVFVVACHFIFPKMMPFVWLVAGFALWVGVGIAFGVLRWLYRQCPDSIVAIKPQLLRTVSIVAAGLKPKQARVEAGDAKVLQFRKRA